MKRKTFTFLLIAALLLPVLSGCNLYSTVAKLEAAEEHIEQRLDAVEERVETQIEDRIKAAVAPQVRPSGNAPEGTLTEDEAASIALEHAGLTADQVDGLRSRYEIDDRVPEFEVEFRQDRREYDYTIHAETGDILSYDRND